MLIKSFLYLLFRKGAMESYYTIKFLIPFLSSIFL
jgi:hypothetical protein